LLAGIGYGSGSKSQRFLNHWWYATKLTRNLAAEFSFFLAVPTMFAAAAYSLFLKDWKEAGVEKKGYELIMESPENIRAFIYW
jgi:undecaprenyl pyrophosphate phosphatase UppP